MNNNDYKEIPITPGIPKGAKFNVREGDFEVKLGHSNLSDPYLVTPELVKWAKEGDGEYCWTLAFWRYNDHENYWSFDPVGSRIFEDIPTGLVPKVWRLMKMMDDYLNQRED